jgi:hypothetical protein
VCGDETSKNECASKSKTGIFFHRLLRERGLKTPVLRGIYARRGPFRAESEAR